MRMPRAFVQAGEHVDPAIEFRLPAATVIGVALVGADPVGAEFEFAFVPLVNGAIGHTEGFPVFQANGVDQRQLLDLFGV